MSHGPSTLGTMITSSRSPISATTCVRSSKTQGLARLFTRVQSCVSPSSISRPTRISPSRAADLRSTGTASSMLPSMMSTLGAISGALATIFSLEKSKKWIIRDGRKGISRSGSGASTASGFRKSRGLRIGRASVYVRLNGPRPATGAAGGGPRAQAPKLAPAHASNFVAQLARRPRAVEPPPSEPRTLLPVDDGKAVEVLVGEPFVLARLRRRRGDVDVPCHQRTGAQELQQPHLDREGVVLPVAAAEADGSVERVAVAYYDRPRCRSRAHRLALPSRVNDGDDEHPGMRQQRASPPQAGSRRGGGVRGGEARRADGRAALPGRRPFATQQPGDRRGDPLQPRARLPERGPLEP